jgi:3'-phosphoadenosine 5'-phosphosulfate sulfotransferase (PAPS reductase)/FAD synthetase
MMSGGAGSYLVAKRVAQKHNRKNVILLFADTKVEEPSLYQFIELAARKLRVKLVKIADGRTPWQLFFDEGFIGNSRVPLCSKKLKREILNQWRDKHCHPKRTTVYIGIDWTEAHRFERFKINSAPYRSEAPLLYPPYLSKRQMVEICQRDGLPMGHLYEAGFSHRNCKGACVQAGQGQWAQLYHHNPEWFWHNAREEERFRSTTGKDVSILREQRNGVRRPLTLITLASRIDQKQSVDMFDLGGCGCAIDDAVSV